MKIAVCVPCHVTHVCYLQDLLRSIDCQTVKPDIVSISISQWSGDTPVLECSVPIELHCTDKTLPAADNRNIAASGVLDRVDVLSFIDADDIMHPRRIELILACMNRDSVDAVYHSYVVWNHMTPIPDVPATGYLQHGQWRIRPSNDPDLTARAEFIVRHGLGLHPFPIHAAHGSVRTHVFRSIQFPLGRRRSDDSEYILQLHESGRKIAILRDRLTYFRMGATTLTCSDASSSQSLQLQTNPSSQ